MLIWQEGAYMDNLELRKLETWAKALMDNEKLCTDVRFLNTYLDDSGKVALGRVISASYELGYKDCIADIWEDIPKVGE